MKGFLLLILLPLCLSTNPHLPGSPHSQSHSSSPHPVIHPNSHTLGSPRSNHREPSIDNEHPVQSNPDQNEMCTLCLESDGSICIFYIVINQIAFESIKCGGRHKFHPNCIRM